MSFEDPSAALPSSETHRWIPVMDLVPGMVLARPVIGGSTDQMTLRIAVGSTITSGAIAQLINKGIECVAVEPDAAADEATHAEDVQLFEARLAEIFGPQPDASCSQLMLALRAEKFPKC